MPHFLSRPVLSRPFLSVLTHVAVFCPSSCSSIVVPLHLYSLSSWFIEHSSSIVFRSSIGHRTFIRLIHLSTHVHPFSPLNVIHVTTRFFALRRAVGRHSVVQLGWPFLRLRVGPLCPPSVLSALTCLLTYLR
ncbi:hypothetical protein BJ912DRAFT_965745 [Pholiota molesta]|nr:hypothetical protein BJ912DRAFT_965745 [Pholiota molesta]